MTKRRDGPAQTILANLAARDALSSPLAETVVPGQIWRVHGHGKSTTGWVRHWQPPHGGQSWHLYYDRLDAEGDRTWCKSFDAFGSAVAYAVQHAGEMRSTPGAQASPTSYA